MMIIFIISRLASDSESGGREEACRPYVMNVGVIYTYRITQKLIYTVNKLS